MSIILTISICLNVFQFIIFIFLVLAYKATLDESKKSMKEIDEITNKIKERLLHENNDTNQL